MDSSSSSGTYSNSRGRLSRPSRRRRLALSLSQKDTLQALFQQNPYPGITTREWLARELDIPESRIQVWFQNQRRRRVKQSRLLSENAFKGGQSQPLRPPPPEALTRGSMGREARRKRTFISPSQTRVLVQAFERDRFPSIAAREELAHQTGIPEPRIQIWFQNRRARHPKQSASGPVNALAKGPDATSAVTALSDQNTLPTVHRSSHRYPPSHAPDSMQSFAAATPVFSPSFLVPEASYGCCVGQPLMFIMLQPSLAALQRCQNPQPLLATVPWGERSHALIASGQPAQGAIWPPAPPETHFWQQQASSGEETSPQLEQQPQRSALTGSSSLLDELLSDVDILDKAGPFLNVDTEEEELAATLEAPLSEEEFNALLDILPGSPVPQV
ncbi:double homeobox protein 4-like protein 4 [Orcinus orca]|uniref:double homeobox protein 4-like protein 4 n=1 Tax=Orcinus orca TaxID=9733 RepID=UPI0021122AE6|nr:double homeobox protein 4-like protein 4 [Orcinus orca]